MCYYCGEALPDSPKIGFSETCFSCGKDLHVCVMCSFYLVGARWDCRETIDAPVADKEKRNFCEWFCPDPRLSVKTAGLIEARGKVESAKSAFDALFTK
ncbi:MAG TPA: hypothetical protein VN445_07320 [Rectinemataceae bacterium]|nr:hypothetical protein [Rectinemataceae bacterium]